MNTELKERADKASQQHVQHVYQAPSQGMVYQQPVQHLVQQTLPPVLPHAVQHPDQHPDQHTLEQPAQQPSLEQQSTGKTG